MKITLVPAEGVADLWPKVSKWLEPAIARCGGRYDLPTVKQALEEERMHLWVAYEGRSLKCALVLNTVQYPAMKVMNILFLGGVDRRNWMEVMRDRVTAFAHDAGAKKIELIGRDGWARDAVKFGYTSPGRLYECSLET